MVKIDRQEQANGRGETKPESRKWKEQIQFKTMRNIFNGHPKVEEVQVGAQTDQWSSNDHPMIGFEMPKTIDQ